MANNNNNQGNIAKILSPIFSVVLPAVRDQIAKQAPVLIEAAKDAAVIATEKVIEAAPVLIKAASEKAAGLGAAATGPMGALVGSAGLGAASVGYVVNKNAGKKARIATRRFNSREDLAKDIAIAEEEKKETEQKLQNIEDDIKDQEEKIFSINNYNIENDENTKFIVMLGITGDGKSTLGNRLCGDTSLKGNNGPFIAKRSGEPVTKHIQHSICTVNDQRCVVVDTPGKNDNEDVYHSNNLADYLYGSGGVNSFILVKNGTNERLDANLESIIKNYENSFGVHFWGHVIIVLTRIEPDLVDEFKEIESIFKNTLNQKFQESRNHNVPIIAVGFRKSYNPEEPYDFGQFNTELLQHIRDDKLLCDNMKSPINYLRQKKTQKQQSLNQLNDNISHLQQRKDEIQQKLDNPEIFVLGRDIND